MCGLSGEFLWWIMLLNLVYFENSFVISQELTNTVFNTNIRKYSVKEDDINATDVKTLQKEEVGRYASFAPIRNPIRFKEIPDNALSSSNYGPGLLHHEHAGHEGTYIPGYGIHEDFYEDGSHYGHGYKYLHSDNNHDFDHHHEDHHGHGHHFGHHHNNHYDDHHGHGHHHLGHGHHHKHHDHHHLGTKALLWPIAGIALLGAAAALVTNPVLLQLGVVSGRRRKRDTVDVSGPDLDSEENLPLDPYRSQMKDNSSKGNGHRNLERKKVPHAGHAAKPDKVNNRFIPIPLKLKRD